MERKEQIRARELCFMFVVTDFAELEKVCWHLVASFPQSWAVPNSAGEMRFAGVSASMSIHACTSWQISVDPSNVHAVSQ